MFVKVIIFKGKGLEKHKLKISQNCLLVKNLNSYLALPKYFLVYNITFTNYLTVNFQQKSNQQSFFNSYYLSK